ncbi:MAG: hypothetical protein R2777_06125 [Chitinophagales bacterium]
MRFCSKQIVIGILLPLLFNDTVFWWCNSNGCDSITTFNVTVNYSTVTTSTSTSCNPADVGTNMTGPFTMANGCDSTHYDTVI